jgi:hypothetical protein
VRLNEDLHVQTSTFKILAVVASIFFFTNYLTGMFLPVYYVELGLRIGDIAALLLITFLIVGPPPNTLTKAYKNFERIFCLGYLHNVILRGVNLR